MYRREDYDQLKLEMPFGVTLREDNRWVILSKKFPWEDIDLKYRKRFKRDPRKFRVIDLPRQYD